MTVRCLVTGGTGFLGMNLLETLEASPEIDSIVSVDLRPLPWSHPKIEAVEDDLGDVDELTRLLDGVTLVFHLAAASNVDVIQQRPDVAVQSNVGLTGNLLEASRRAGVERLVFASTAWVYMNAEGIEMTEDVPLFPHGPANLYAATKLAAEMLCRSYAAQFGQPFTVLRFDTPYGRYMRPDLVVQRFLDQAMNGEVITIAGGGQQTRGFLYAEDLTRACLMAALSPAAAGGTFNLSGPRPVSIAELAEIVQRTVPDAPGVRFTESRAADFKGQRVSPELARRTFGWRPRVEIEEGIQRIHAWLGGAVESRCIA